MDMIIHSFRLAFAICLALVLGSCATAPSGTGGAAIERGFVLRSLTLDDTVEDRILALDPDHISGQDVHSTLAAGPTPRIILLHGSVYPDFLIMTSFANFLEGMGYPEAKLRDPLDGAYSQSPYGNTERIAGEVAWYYEHDGVRPLMIGHSLGGMQAVKVLYELAGDFTHKVNVWNARIDRPEKRFTIVDPLTGVERPVVGLSVAYASAIAAGGAAFILPNQWDMLSRLHKIPNTVDEFTGYAIRGDLIAWSFAGISSASNYRAAGVATVRNVVLPVTYNHITVPITHGLAEDQRTRDWINAYVPHDSSEVVVPADVATFNILWAADVWFSIKKHWCLEAQRLIRAKRAASPLPIRPNNPSRDESALLGR
ncbi:MAG TPA: hypothetical protein VGK37_15645 [Casimicrobiaceae bacterium]|jgi:hypothetical protein